MVNSPGITLLGLGPGDPGLLTRQAWDVLRNAPEVYLRTTQHPTVAGFPAGLVVHSFDEFYDSGMDFPQVYERIIEQVLALGRRPQGVVYAVPGHPFVAETTAPEIARQARAAGIPVAVVAGLSFLEPTLAALGVDPLPQLSLVDALELVVAHHPPFPPSAPGLIAQLHSQAIAAEVKITLMAVYPDEHPVMLVHAAGMPEEVIEQLPLHAIDHSPHIGLLTSLYIPPLAADASFEAFQELVAHLRAPEGCPWDREQTHQSLRPNLLEETYETLNALDLDDPQAMQEEFGDLLLQIVLHAQIASEYGEFSMADILQGIHSKLVKRHPHVFGELDLDNADDVIHNWERIKAVERQDKGDGEKSLLDGVSPALPALAQADAYQKRAARVGFDWPEVDGVLAKIIEEIEEIKSAPDPAARAGEIGDLFFALVNLARWYKVDAESVLRQTNAKFHQRFIAIETTAKAQGRAISEMTLEEMDAIWEAAKAGG
ncbi:MAG: nucleoside triphosphate pyrophosphohydrolase [Anaerolineae bacterium]|nr:nucleoside triphosphate pyrophosphohydrolase [Anaerolineae bacterium]